MVIAASLFACLSKFLFQHEHVGLFLNSNLNRGSFANDVNNIGVLHLYLIVLV